MFESDVAPVLRAKCWSCHGSKAPKAQLDLTTAAGAVKGGESGPAIVRGARLVIDTRNATGALAPQPSNVIRL